MRMRMRIRMIQGYKDYCWQYFVFNFFYISLNALFAERRCVAPSKWVVRSSHSVEDGVERVCFTTVFSRSSSLAIPTCKNVVSRQDS